jgi:threonine/homoserine/homoserine lactone efflux protein
VLEYASVQEFTNIWLFFASAIFISLTGVMTPGPLFAAAVAKGYKDDRAGIKIALGHGIVEFPLMALIVVSMDFIFENDIVKLGIGLVGGVLLLALGGSMIRSRKMVAGVEHEYIPFDSVTAGAVTSLTNPYFLLWWATVGAVLILNAEYFGPIIVVVFAVVHWSCDLVWYTFTSMLVFRTKHLWTPRVHEYVFGICGLIMVLFGVYFLVGPTAQLLD